MQKKLKKSLISSIVILLLLSFLLFFVGCTQKDNSSNTTSTTQPETPNTPTITPTTPPSTQANIFKEIKDWLHSNVQPEGDNYIFPLYDNVTINYASNLIYNIKEDALYLTGNENTLREVNLKIPYLPEYSTFEGYEISANFTISTKTLYGFLTLPIHKFSSMADNVRLPDFEYIAEMDNQNAPTNDEAMQFRTALCDKLNNLLTAFNQFYVEKIQNSNQTYNGAIFKYFYLPVMLKI